MYSFKFVCLLVLFGLIKIVCCYTISKSQYSADGDLPESLTVGDGQSIFLYWRPSVESLRKCSLTTPSNKTIDLLKGSQGNFKPSTTLKFQDGYCCVKIIKMKFNGNNGTYVIKASDGHNNFSTKTQLNVAAPVVVVNTTLTVVEGSTRYLYCGSDKAIFCTLHHPRGEIQSFGGRCQHAIFSASYFQHNGFWNCSFIVPDYVTEFNSTVEVKIIEDDKKEIFINETTDEVAFFCIAPEKQIFNKYCKIITPYGKELFLTPGKVYGRYTYYGDKPNYCGVRIPKPLALQDIGPWGCQLVSSLGQTPDIYGGYLNIGTEEKLRKVYVENEKIFMTDSFSSRILRCHVPYSIEFCWFRSPNGTVFNIQDRYIIDSSSNRIQSLGFKFGDCSFKLDSLKKAEIKNNTGKWTCHIGMVKESVNEVSGSIQLLYSDVPIIQLKEEVNGEIGSSVEIGCYTGSGMGLKYCRLVRPDGMGISVDPNKNNSDYSYYGRGLLHGDCGVTIHSLKSEDIGSWSCTVKLIELYSPSQEYSTHINLLKEKGSSVAVYIVVGILSLISLLFLSYIVTKRFELKIQRRRSDEDDGSLLESEIQRNSPTQRFNQTINFVRKRSRPTSTSTASSSPQPEAVTQSIAQFNSPGTTYI